MNLRGEIISSYEVPRLFYKIGPKRCAVKKLDELGCLIRYALELGYTARKKRAKMDVDAVVDRWAKVVVGLAVAHDKDEADRYEAAIEECLVPILSAPIKQIREFYPKLLAKLKSDPAVPFLVWRGYEIWIEGWLSQATDESVKELKTELAAEIARLVEQDVKDQIPEALIRALQWRDAETLEKVKNAVVEGKATGQKPRLRGRESCLFLEVGGTETNPDVCVQI